MIQIPWGFNFSRVLYPHHKPRQRQPSFLAISLPLQVTSVLLMAVLFLKVTALEGLRICKVRWVWNIDSIFLNPRSWFLTFCGFQNLGTFFILRPAPSVSLLAARAAVVTDGFQFLFLLSSGDFTSILTHPYLKKNVIYHRCFLQRFLWLK